MILGRANDFNVRCNVSMILIILFQFVDDKISRKILSEARKQQEQLIEEIGIDRFVLLHQFMY